MNRRLLTTLLALLLSVGLAACGDEDSDAEPDASGDTAEPAADGDFPVTVRGVTLDGAPERIVSLSATTTETLFAIGAGDQVVAADEHSNHPEDAPDTDLSGFEPNVEAVAGYEPDLVIVSDDRDGIVDALADLEIPTLVMPAAVEIDDVYEQIEDLGAATGHVESAGEVAAEVEGEIAAIVEEVGDAGAGLTYYYELDPQLYSVTSSTFIGQVLGLLGLENIADEAGGDSDYPQLSAEYIVDQDPDLILLADTKCCQQDAESVAARAGWEGMQAVPDGVVELDDDIASRWGPRLPQLLASVADAVLDVAA